MLPLLRGCREREREREAPEMLKKMVVSKPAGEV